GVSGSKVLCGAAVTGGVVAALLAVGSGANVAGAVAWSRPLAAMKMTPTAITANNAILMFSFMVWNGVEAAKITRCRTISKAPSRLNRYLDQRQLTARPICCVAAQGR